MTRVLFVGVLCLFSVSCLAHAGHDSEQMDTWRRACAYLHNESCSELNPEPGPCTNQEKCLTHVCTPGTSGSCADDSTLSFCEDIDCPRVAPSVRQMVNPLGKLFPKRERSVIG